MISRYEGARVCRLEQIVGGLSMRAEGFADDKVKLNFLFICVHFNIRFSASALVQVWKRAVDVYSSVIGN